MVIKKYEEIKNEGIRLSLDRDRHISKWKNYPNNIQHSLY